MSSSLALQPQAVSAPGKVFVAGGYLVLDRKYTALVFGLDARIHVEIEPIQTKSGVTLSEIIVRSPQFRDAAWEYGYRLTEGDGGIAVTQLRASHTSSLNKNPFIETALTYALTYISTLQSTPIPPSSISILADQAYYSNPGSPLSPSSRFLNFDVTLPDAHKTGLGSSAALVTAFTAAVLSYYLPKEAFDVDSEKGKSVLHNLSQASHCAAQGKVGSGFDIASAVYGSCLYRRFSPSLLSSLPAPGAASFAAQLRSLVEGDSWDVEIAKAKVKMPRGLRLVMCDVDCGSQTPGMVRTVLKWREQNPELADRIWGELQSGNEAFAAELTRLATEDSGEAGAEKFAKLKGIFEANRKLIREMSKESGVPIEPPQQTKLLDACSAVAGVVGGVVPGAGGYDAIVLLLEDKEEVIGELRKVVEGWKVDGHSEDGVTIGKVGILGVREDMVGVRREDVVIYREWITSS
ncbi:phosphomevalonate kinase [Paraphaeosphaeria sporulosa]|uniref:Phosphomevalonate kinase n=1 Tax=Paraphaeosphaeria sporulosa TaxID=1460663 RepID=A0A177CZC4_9PLEO|nr:phosphomevalonate kinase [Paraphaeosphaeria sporulosa]OAG12636.1 phosphomevalonate kinase [Paraphaeosphaeria sporulosa]